jgi:1,4-alpha-glucan branching enzyme
VDGIRLDMTLFMRHVRGDGDPTADLPDGWTLAQWISSELRSVKPNAIIIAEDLQDNDWLTKTAADGGAGFSAQWSAAFVHPLRGVIEKEKDEWRDLEALREAIGQCFNGDPFQRVVYSESHDEVANGKARVPQEVSPMSPGDWFAQKRSSLAAALVMSSPGIPMLFQGQEFLQSGWFDDTDPLNWHLEEEHRGLVNLYRDLCNLRLNHSAVTRGLCGSGLNVYHVDNQNKVISWHRWDQRGPGDDVVVIANFSSRPLTNYRLGMPAAGVWRPRLNSDWSGYSPDFSGTLALETATDDQPCDGYGFSVSVELAPYTVLIYSQDRA